MASSERRFAALFARRRSERRLAVLPYAMAGYPSPDRTVDLLRALADEGADGFELGIPFSDPLADGPTVQRAGQIALEAGTTPTTALEIVSAAREHLDQPIALMGYMNPIVNRGIDRFCADAASAGADALIVPDVPPEEASELATACERNNLDLIAFVAPTTSATRLKTVARAARGFIYCVSLTGVTGVRADLATGLEEVIASIRAVTTTPVVVGFGISRPEHLTFLRGRADGAIVASVLIDRMERHPEDPIRQAAALLKELRAGADAEGS